MKKISLITSKLLLFIMIFFQSSFKYSKQFINEIIKEYYTWQVRSIENQMTKYISEFDYFIDLEKELYEEGVYKPREYIKGYGKFRLDPKDEVRRDNERLPRAYVSRATNLFIALWIRYDLHTRILRPISETHKTQMQRETMLLMEDYPEASKKFLDYQEKYTDFLIKIKRWEDKHYIREQGTFITTPKENYLQIDQKLTKNLARVIGMSEEEIAEGKLKNKPEFLNSKIEKEFENLKGWVDGIWYGYDKDINITNSNENPSYTEKKHKTNEEKSYAQTPFEKLMHMEYSNSIDKGNTFEHFCATLLHKMGYIIQKVEGGPGDRMIDLRIISDEPIPIKFAVQCKHYPNSSKIVSDVIQHAISTLHLPNESFDKAIVMTSNLFTKDAIELANESNIILFDTNEINKLSTKFLSKMTFEEIDSLGKSFRRK